MPLFETQKEKEIYRRNHLKIKQFILVAQTNGLCHTLRWMEPSSSLQL